jgi:hypothetical protein
MQTPADLNANADAIASLYDGVALFTADPGVDGSNLAGGGDVQAVTFSAGGAAGATADYAAVDGIAWSGLVSFTLTEKATHLGLYSGATFMRGEPLPAPLGPGDVLFAFGVGPAAY